MKLSQIAAIVATLIVSLVVVMWLASTVPSTVFENSQQGKQNGQGELDPTEDGVERTNPFDLTTEGPHPKVVFETGLYNFGKLAIGQSGSHDFVIKNESDVPLLLAKGPVQCKCTITGLKQESVPPGEEALIHLEYEPKTLGEFGQGALIWTNDPVTPELRLRVEGTMVTDVQVFPTNGWTLGAISSHKLVELNGGIASAIDESFEITSIETSSDAVKMEAPTMSAEDLTDSNSIAGYRLIGSYQPSAEAGSIEESVKVYTTLKNHPVFEFQITGSRSGPISIIGPGWTAGSGTLSLGRVTAEKGETRRLTFMVEPSEKELEILEITTSPSFVKATVKAEKNAPGAARHRFTFVVEIPKGSPKGIWNAKNLGQVTIKTTHPELKKITLNLVMTIQ